MQAGVERAHGAVGGGDDAHEAQPPRRAGHAEDAHGAKKAGEASARIDSQLERRNAPLAGARRSANAMRNATQRAAPNTS